MKHAVVGLLLVALLLGCAKKGRPGGGPEDKTGPFVTLWSPVAGADSVTAHSAVTLTWSEPVQRSTVEDRVIVSPDTVRVDKTWDGTTLTLLPRRGWLPDVVHWVWIGPGALDRHGLPMEEAFGLWFSTGTGLSTRVEGTAVTGASPAAGAVVTATRDDSALRWTCLTDASGGFVAAGLAPGMWHIEAFADNDGDRAYRRGIEPWAALTVEVPPDSAAFVRLALAPEDTAPPVARDVRVDHSRSIRIGFSEALREARSAAFALHDTAGLGYPIQSVNLSAADPAAVRLLLRGSLRDDLMVVTASDVLDSAGLSLADTALTFVGTSLADTVPPAVYRLLYDAQPGRLWIMFTEPMEESGRDSLTILEAPGLRPVPGVAVWRDMQVLAWSASGLLPPDRRLLAVLSGARDLAGNPLTPPLVCLLPSPADSVVPAWEAQPLPPP
ncbi:Ig-like domain-containing protein [Candidatus Fermentibacteria bacterium]|nr:Ig-like domain-containing protein [Candidatus Fermentibacteria bacterium]